MTQPFLDKHPLEFDKEHGPLLLFFEQSGVPACRWVMPHLDALLKDFPQVKLIRVDVQAQPELCQQFGVRRAPHVSFVSHGKSKAGLTGVYTPAFMRKWLDGQLGS